MRRLRRLAQVLALVALSTVTSVAIGHPAEAVVQVQSCRPVQMHLSLGLTREVWAGQPVKWIGWVRYTNTGLTCRMVKTDVGIQAVSGTRHVPLGTSSLNDVVARPPFVMAHGESARALVGLLKMPSKVAYSCVPVPIDGIEILGYLYHWPNHYFSLSRWREIGLCHGDRLAAIGGVLTLMANVALSSPAGVHVTPACSRLVVGATSTGGAGGTGETTLLIANSGPPCEIEGYPRIELFSASGSLMKTTNTHSESYIFAEPAPRTVVLAQGAVASVGVSWSDNPVNNERCARAAWMEVSLPNGATIGSPNFRGAPCGGYLWVTPFEAGPLPANA
jgi:hypothetical protein